MSKLLTRLLGTKSHLIGLACAGGLGAVGILGMVGSAWPFLIPLAYLFGVVMGFQILGETLKKETIVIGSNNSDLRVHCVEKLKEIQNLLDSTTILNIDIHDRLSILIQDLHALSMKVFQENEEIGSSEVRTTTFRVIDDYLPNLVEAFLALPKDYASTKIIRNGKTANDILVGRIELLSEQTAQMMDLALEKEAGDFLTHARFLDEKFADSSATFKIK